MPQNGNCANPKFLFVDTSSILSLAAGNSLKIFSRLKSDYGIVPLVTEIVEFETRRNIHAKPKFFAFRNQVMRTFDLGGLAVLDDQFVESSRLGDTFLDSVEEEAKRIIDLGIDEGEAYTHAAANALGSPVLTNDTAALNKFQKNGKSFTGTIRSFDMMAFGFQIGCFDEKHCDDARSSMLQVGEAVERVFRNRSFSEGLEYFYVRIVDGERVAPGKLNPVQKFDNYRLTIRR